MQTFQEFLASRVQEAKVAERRARRDEWIVAVVRLIELLQRWLMEADPERILDVIPIELERTEPSLGRYRLNGLRISLGEDVVQVLPVGRDSVGFISTCERAEIRTEGRVDITAGVRRHILYRTLENGSECWYALDDRFQATPLDRTRFEQILQDLLA